MATCSFPMKKLKDVCTRITDGTHVTPKYLDKGIPFLSVKNVKPEGIDFDNVKFISKEEHRKLTARCKPLKGDILLTKVGTIGVAKEVQEEIEFSIFVSVALLKPDATVIDSSYLEYALNYNGTQNQFRKRLKGIGVRDLHLEEIREVEIPLPLLEKQRKIAGLLRRGDSLRRNREKTNKTHDLLLQSIFNKMFGQQSDCLQEIKWIAIEDCMEAIIDYRGKTPPKTSIGIPLVTAKIVGDRELFEPNEFISPDIYDKWMVRGFPRYGDVIFTTEAPLGKVAQLKIKGKVALAQRILLLRGKKDVVSNEFLMYALTSNKVRHDIESRSTGSTVKGIRQKEFRKVKIPVPPVELQNNFSDIARKIDSIHAQRNVITQEINQLSDCLMSKVFKGQLCQ